MPMLATNDGMVYARNCDFGIRLEIHIHCFKQDIFFGIFSKFDQLW